MSAVSSTRDAERLAAAPTLNARGVSLRAVTDASRRLDELSTARVVGEAAEAIHKAQKSGQSVGGVSPDAIVILPTGEITLDLPSGKAVGYSPPERLRGSTGDRRSDVFSLGVVLWEALAHERLFGGATDEAIKSAVLEREYRPLAQLNANVPAELDAICKKALARDPADRYQSAKVMAAEISAVLDDAGYPEANEEIAKYIAAEFPAGALPKPPVVAAAAPRGKSTSGQSGRVGATTNLGMPALREPAPVTIPPIAKPSAPAPSGSGSTPTRDRTPTPAPPSKLPTWATQRPAEPPPSPTTTLLGTGSPPATPKISPAVLGPIPGGTLPAAPGARDSAMSADEAPAISAGSTNPGTGETRPTGAPEVTPAGGEPGATSSKVAQPSVGAKTSVTGSRSDADAAKPPPQPASIASSDTLPAAAVSAEIPPARPALEPANSKTVPAAGSLPAAEDDFAEPRDETPNPA
ncbi:MAG: protein kinase domain-containing protein, partial [Kofleriaceae bacterium]